MVELILGGGISLESATRGLNNNIFQRDAGCRFQSGADNGVTAIPLLLTDEGSTGRLGFLPARGALYSSWKFRILEARSVSIETVLQRHEDALMALANVAAVGLGKKAERPVIMVHVTKKFPAAALSKDQIVPSELEGYEVVVAEIGTITAPEPPTDPH